MLVFDTFIETLETKLPRCVCYKYCRLQKRLPPKPRKTVPNRRAEQAPLALAALSSRELSAQQRCEPRQSRGSCRSQSRRPQRSCQQPWLSSAERKPLQWQHVGKAGVSFSQAGSGRVKTQPIQVGAL